jgi:MFS family permease
MCAVVVGAILTARVRGNMVGPLCLIAGSAWVIYLFGTSYGIASMNASEPMPGDYFFGWLGGWLGALLPPCIAAVIMVYPTGEAVGRWRILLLGPIAAALSSGIAAIIIWGAPLATLTNTRAVGRAAAPFLDLAFLIGWATILPATISLFARYRRANSVERQQIKWLLAATSLLVLTFVVGLATGSEDESGWGTWILGVALAAIPIAILVAVLRYHLYEIDRIISRTVSYAIVIGVLAGAYVAGFAMLSSLFSESSLAVAASTLAAAALFTPVRRRVQAWVERRFNRSHYDAQRVIEGFSETMRGNLETRTLIRGWSRVVAETMQPSFMSVWVRNDSGTLEG